MLPVLDATWYHYHDTIISQFSSESSHSNINSINKKRQRHLTAVRPTVHRASARAAFLEAGPIAASCNHPMEPANI